MRIPGTPKTLHLLLALGLTACGDVGEDPRADAAEAGLEIVNPEDPARDWFFDLGHVPYGEVASVTVRLKNRDPRPLTFLDVQPGCGCTAPSLRWTRPDGSVVEGRPDRRGDLLTIPPGAIADLTLEVDTRQVPRRNASKLVVIRIRTDSRNNPFQRIELHVIVDLPFSATPEQIDLGIVASGAGGTGSTQILAATAEALRLERVVEAPDFLQTELTLGESFGREVWTLDVRAVPPLTQGPFKETLVFSVLDSRDEPTDRTFEVAVVGRAAPDLEVFPPRLSFASVESAGSIVAEVELIARLPGLRVSILDTTIDGSAAADLAVELSAVEPDDRGRSDRWRVRLRAPASLAGSSFSGILTLHLDQEQFGEVRVPYIGRLGL